MNPIEALLVPLFEEVSDGICASDAGGKMLYMNPAAEDFLETKLGLARGRSLCELLCGQLATVPAPECASTCALRVAGGTAKAITFKGVHNRRPLGEGNETDFKRMEKLRSLRVRCMRMPTADGAEGVCLTILENASTELERQRRREFWHNMVAHDLRNPLKEIIAAARELKEIIAAARERQEETPGAELLKMYVQDCQQITDFLDRSLDAAKLEAGLMPVKLTNLPLAAILAACVEDQAPLARGKRVEIKIEAPSTIPVLADPDLLPRVISNLLNNAVKFTPEGSQVVLKAEPEGKDAVRLSVQDAGSGINPEELSKIKGTGLGLAFCREALKAMNGSLTVESRPGTGSVFSMRLPRNSGPP